jgi:hypothetical protein
MSDQGAAGNGNDAGTSPALPLFYKNPRPVNREVHEKKSVKKERDFAFAANTNSIPIAASEFPAAAANYPILFTSGEPAAPIALLGLERGQNLFVSDGKWAQGCYVPAYARRYPFIFSDVPGNDQLALCIDEESGFLEDGDANPIFIDGEPSEQLKTALNFCEHFQRDFTLTSDFSSALSEAGLLAPKEMTYNSQDGQRVGLTGFRVIDEKKLNELPDETFLEWRKKGWLAPIYAHLLSIANVSALAVRRGM